MKRNSLKVVLGVIAALLLTSVCFAAVNVPITATVPQVNLMTVTISKVVGTTFTGGQTSMAFGTLVYNAANKIFTAPHYFAVDVGIISNAAWQVALTKASIISGTNNLNSHVNVTFMKQTSSTAGTMIGSKLAFADAGAARTFNSTNFNPSAGEWLRIYYGLGTGLKTGADADALTVTPVPAYKAQGLYTGSITLTLTP